MFTYFQNVVVLGDAAGLGAVGGGAQSLLGGGLDGGRGGFLVLRRRAADVLFAHLKKIIIKKNSCRNQYQEIRKILEKLSNCFILLLKNSHIVNFFCQKN